MIRSHSRPDGAELIERADAWFAERGHGWVVTAREGGEDASLEAAAEAAGLVKVLDRYPRWAPSAGWRRPRPPGSSCAPSPTRPTPSSSGASARVAYPAIGFPEDAFDRFPPATLLHPASAAFLGEIDGEPVATAMTTVLDGVGFVGWVGTTEAARGRGAGAAITVAATNAAFDRGAWLASLQASPMGESIYARLGYRELFNYRLWARARPST